MNIQVVIKNAVAKGPSDALHPSIPPLLNGGATAPFDI